MHCRAARATVWHDRATRARHDQLRPALADQVGAPGVVEAARAGAVVTPRTLVRSRTLWKGNPARLSRELSPQEIEFLSYSAAHYVRLKDRYLAAGT